MVSVRELYELWAGDSELDAALGQTLEPRGTDWLFDLFSSLGPRPGETFVDVGTRDARHAIRLVREHGLRGTAVDPVPGHVDAAREAVAAAGLEQELEIVEGVVESLPLPDESVDWVWCRDVLVHADVARGLAECGRVLRPGGGMLAYVTLATGLLEPHEEALLVNATALVPESLRADRYGCAAEDAGLALVEEHELGGEWRERMIEDGSWNPADVLLRLSRLRRREAELEAEFGRTALDAYVGGQLWGIYQLLGKLRPTVFVWARRG